jgi:hypothetical protein
MVAPVQALLEQLAAALAIYNDLQARAMIDEKRLEENPYALISPIQYQLAGAFVAAAVSAVENGTGRDSTRSQFARKFAGDYDKLVGGVSPTNSRSLPSLKGIVEETHAAILNGHLVSYEELIHGDMFGDVLEEAEHLHSEGYKDPAAVLAGTSLELHLKKLCAKHTITVAPKASIINDDLKRAGAYGGLEHKQVIAWQKLRNDAAHGDYSNYDTAQVALMIQGVRDFIVKYPA